MSISKFINKKWILKDQKRMLKSYLGFGMPIGYLIGQSVTIIMSGWDKYHFDLLGLLFVIIIDVIVCSPFILNIIKYRKKYNYTINFLKKNRNVEVKCLYDYKKNTILCAFSANKLYKLEFVSWDNGKIYIHDDFNWRHNYYNVINKFELQDLRGERLKKLKKLKIYG